MAFGTGHVSSLTLAVRTTAGILGLKASIAKTLKIQAD